MPYPRLFLALLLSVSVPSASHGQIVITEADFLSRVPGSFITDVYFTPCSFSAPLVCDEQVGIQTLLDIDGASQTWDFTALTWADLDSNDVIPHRYVRLPAGLPGDNDPRVADATYAQVAGPQFVGSTGGSYYNTSPTQHLSYGTYEIFEGGVYDALYDGPLLEYTLPLAMGSAWEGQAKWRDNTFGVLLDITLDLVGTVTGWGTIVTPAGTFDALRVNRTRTITTQPQAARSPLDTLTNVEFRTKGNLFAAIQILADPSNPGSNILLATYQVTREAGTGNPPGDQPGNQRPEDGFQFSGDPELSWDSISGAGTYHIQVGTDPLGKGSGNPIVIDEAGLTVTAYAPAGLDVGTTYHWRVRGVNGAGPGPWTSSRSFVTAPTHVGVEHEGAIPTTFELFQNYPNPFVSTTTIRFDVSEPSTARLSVFDVLGREIALLADRRFSPGQYQFRWDATGLESGVYIYRLESGATRRTGTMLLAR